MQAQEYISNLNSYKNLITDNKNGRLFHSIMLVNADEEFLLNFAKLLSSEILCKAGDDKEIVCSRVMKEIHPDLSVIGKDKAIDVSVAKDLVVDVFVAPYEGDRKVYIISKFDEINPAVANKLLKTLEEPPKGVTFLLLVKNDSRVLQTLLSRSQKVYVEGFSLEQTANILTNDGQENAELISILADGNISMARKLSKQTDPLKMTKFVFSVFKELKLTTDVIRFVSEAENFKDNLPALFSFFAKISELAIRDNANRSVKINKLIDQEVQNVASVWNERALVLVIDATIVANKMIESYVSVNNVLDQFFLKVLEVRRKCKVL